MSIAYPVQQGLPNTVNFEPTGGPNGDPCFKLDTQGSLPTMLAIRVPMIQEADWDVAVEATIDTTDLAVSSNGFEGWGIRSRLLRSGVSEPIVLDDNGLLTGHSELWYTVRTGWHLRHQTIILPNDRPDVLDLTMCVKGPVGASAKVSQFTVVNKYTKSYTIEIPGESDRVQLTYKQDTNRDWVNRTFLTNIGTFVTIPSYLRTTDAYQEAYLDTISCDIKRDEQVRCSLTAIVGVVFSSFTHLPFTYQMAIKFRSPEGRELWKVVISESYSSTVKSLTANENTIEFVADQNYNQASLVLTVRSNDGSPVITTVSRAGIFLEMQTRRPIL